VRNTHNPSQHSRQSRQSGIPSPHAPGSVEISSHNFVIGRVARDDGSFFAFNDRGILLGEYPHFAEALRAFREIVFDEVM
jgi:hypothetical protein